MKLISLELKNYKIIDDLKIDFDYEKTINVIIGKNGAGKTTVIECLTIIFSTFFKCKSVSELKDAKFPFQFTIRYGLRKEKTMESTMWGHSYVNYIGLEFSYEKELSISLYEGPDSFTDWDVIEKKLRGEGVGVNYLFPENVVVYYSGISNIIYSRFSEFQQEMILGSLDGQSTIDQPFYYFLAQNFPTILIGLLCYEYGSVPDLLVNKFSIEGFKSIHVEIKKPDWAKSNSRPQEFWGAKGDLSTFLTKLTKISSSFFGKDIIVFTIESPDQLMELREEYGSEKRLFEYLVSLQANGLITKIDIDLIKGGVNTPYQRLSEGEKQLLVVIGLKELLAADNSLFLLDEPDTYLHPEWKRDIMFDFFKDDLEARNEHSNFFIITSHSPNIVSAVSKKQLRILVNDGGKSRLRSFQMNPYGKPVDDILLDLFGIDGLRYKKVEEELKRLQALVINNDYDKEEFQTLLKQLEKELGPQDEALSAIQLEIVRRKKDAKDK